MSDKLEELQQRCQALAAHAVLDEQEIYALKESNSKLKNVFTAARMLCTSNASGPALLRAWAELRKAVREA